MAEWHITPDYIVNNWTDELFSLMVEKLAERKERETEKMSGNQPIECKVPVETLAAMSGGMIKVVKH